MMASAARDPYWRSRVLAESAAAGPDADKIQAKCLRCHAATDEYPLRLDGKRMRLQDLTDLGREGVTCTVCHRIDPSGLGSRSSLTGGFRITADPVIFGPHERPFSMPMLHHTGFRPVASGHIRDAALCGTCHTLLLTDAAGTVTLAEQTTWMEWLASDYPRKDVTCQTCHVPLMRGADGKPSFEYIAHRPPGGPFPPTRPRSPVGQHTFLGGNVQMLRFLGSIAESDGLRQRADAVSRFLRSAVALNVVGAMVTDGRVVASVTIRNLTGHKLPTGLPGRRLWLHLTAFDPAGRSLFESGGWNPTTGELQHVERLAVHRDKIDRPDQTAIYEALIEDARGDLTPLLTHGVRYRKDNRLLPVGFSDAVRLPEGLLAVWIRPVGTSQDSNFKAGQDTVEYRIAVPKHLAHIRISVEACFQSIRPTDAASVPGLHRGLEVIGTAEVIVTGR